MKLSRILVILLVAILLLAIMVNSVPAQETEALPLGEHGPYGVGWRRVIYVDESRGNRRLETIIWYPAVIPEGAMVGILGLQNAEPDASGSPYPLIVYSHYRGGSNRITLGAGPHLASYGFVVASASHNDTDTMLVNRPFDVLFLIDQLAALTDDPLAGLVDADNVGVTGFGLGGETALLVNGTQIDPASYEEACPDPPRSVSSLDLCYYRYTVWDELVAYRAQFDTLNEGDLWPAITDARIHAVVPVDPCNGPLFGERGLAGATVPTLIIGLLNEDVCPYRRDAAFIYDHLGAEDRYLVTLMHVAHAEAMGATRAFETFNHFATAFFGYYLQGREDYGDYLTADFVDQYEDLAWGPVEIQGE
jgi:predicted dienelactone hydrolase